MNHSRRHGWKDRWLCLAFIGLFCVSSLAYGADTQTVQPDFGQLILHLRGGFRYRSVQTGDDAIIHFSNAGALKFSDHLPRNIKSISKQGRVLHLSLVPGAKLQINRLGNRLLLDVYDPMPAKPAAPPPPVSPPPPILPPDGPVHIAITRTDMPADTAGSAILVPFNANVGAAAFVRGAHEIIVFDDASPLDVAQIAQDPQFGGSDVTLLQNATVLRLPLPGKGAVRLMRVDAGWLVMIEDQPTVNAAIEPVARDRQLFFAATDAAKSVVIQDNMTGESLLVATQKTPGQAVLVQRQAPEYQLLPSDMGVVVEPVSDRLHLSVQKDGFLLGLSGAGPDLTLPSASAPRMADAAHLTRLYDFPAQSSPALLDDMQSEIVAAALSPPLSRFEPRGKVAQTMVALGLDVEAEGVMDLAIGSDASQSDNAEAKGLQAIAATLAGRLDEATGLDAPALDHWDDVKLWRAVRDAPTHPGDPAIAAQFAATAPLILAYPEALQARLAPIAVEAMALGGKLDAARALAAKRPDDTHLALGRAIIDEKLGNVDKALAEYDALNISTDRDARARAADRAVELRLATGRLGPAEAATALEHHFLDWRGDDRELALRERAAALRAQTHDWRNALALLREAEIIYPDDIAGIQKLMTQYLGDMLRANGAAALSPLELVALADENADLIANDPQAGELSGILADKLIALDLPQRAAPVLQKLLQAAQPGIAAARIAVKLAEVQLDQNNPQAALDALNNSNADGLPDNLIAERAMAAARAMAAQNKPDQAAQLLMALNDAKADDLRARIMENVSNWPAAEAALGDLAAKSIPAGPSAPPLSDAQRDILVRLASAAAQAGDAARLQSLRAMQPRMGSGDRADMFRLLTAAPMQGLDDLARVKTEDALAHAVPGAMKSLQ